MRLPGMHKYHARHPTLLAGLMQARAGKPFETLHTMQEHPTIASTSRPSAKAPSALQWPCKRPDCAGELSNATFNLRPRYPLTSAWPAPGGHSGAPGRARDAPPIGVVAEDGGLHEGGGGHRARDRARARVVRGAARAHLDQARGALAVPRHRLGQALRRAGRL